MNTLRRRENGMMQFKTCPENFEKKLTSRQIKKIFSVKKPHTILKVLYF